MPSTMTTTTRLLVACLVVALSTSSAVDTRGPPKKNVVLPKDLDETVTTTESSSSSSSSSKIIDAKHLDVIEWVRANGGYFNPKLEIRLADPTVDDPKDSYFGVFATEPIDENEQLLFLPRAAMLVVGEQGKENYHGDLCDLSKALLKEMALGDASHYAPYTRYIQHQILSKPGQIPATWSPTGKSLFRKLLHKSQLPPGDATDWMDDFDDWCLDDNDEERQAQEAALAIVVQRGWDRALCPIYDMINHDNGKVNTINTSVYGKHGFRVWASTALPVGGEVFNTYDDCLDCKGTASIWGTPEILRDFGFVESYPQRWHFHAQEVSFTLYKEEAADGVEEYSLEFIEETEPSVEALQFFEDHLARLSTIVEEEWQPVQHLVPQHEYERLVQYHEALVIALETVIEISKQELEEMEDDEVSISTTRLARDAAATKRRTTLQELASFIDSESCVNDGTCHLRYLQLVDDFDALNRIDNFYRSVYQCLTLIRYNEDYVVVDTIQSNYQKIDYWQHPETKDTCFYLDTIFQMCGSYWPHYHEMVVHKTAKYVKDAPITRVLWVGGGDSGLLNEILRYPQLQLVVGLELDQRVTRGAYQHFGSRPHYDDPRVQWWYGDASKSLLMLPSHYFGSFDMVLVDLSDTVFSLSVTDGLDVVGALSLLLRKGGIFEMNELFFQRVSNVFEHAIHYSYTDIPKVCDQSLIMAGNDVDFFSKQQHERAGEEILDGDKLFVERSSHKTTHAYQNYHDYRHNPNATSQTLCVDAAAYKNQATIKTQKTSPGILLVIEAEECNDLEAAAQVDKVTDALNKAGFPVLHTMTAANADGRLEFVVIIQQGYIVVRPVPEAAYAAVDVHVWAGFDQHEMLKKVIVEDALGSKSIGASFRIVAGGMFGVDTWQADAKLHGPQMDEICKDHTTPPAKTTTIPPAAAAMTKKKPASVHQAMLEQALQFVNEPPVVVAVICGHDDDDCPSVKAAAEQHDKVSHVIPLKQCPDLLATDTEYTRRPIHGTALKDPLFECEKQIEEQLKKESKVIGAVIMDPSASRVFAQVIHRVFAVNFKAQGVLPNYLADHVVCLATMDADTSWRRHWVSKFPSNSTFSDRHVDPYQRAELLVRDNTSNATVLEVSWSASGDEYFFKHLVQAVDSVQLEDDGLHLHIQHVFGGLKRPKLRQLMPDDEPQVYVLPQDVDHSKAHAQWHSEHPIGHQSLVQMETEGTLRTGDRISADYQGEGVWYPGTITHVYTTSSPVTYDILYDDGDQEEEVERDMIKQQNAGYVPILEPSELEALKRGLVQASIDKHSGEIPQVEQFDIAEGCVLTMFWSQGMALVVWDGRNHVDLNLYTNASSSKDASRIHKKFIYHLQAQTPRLKTTLLDEQPRGYGRVVSFAKDVKRVNGVRHDPHWIKQ